MSSKPDTETSQGVAPEQLAEAESLITEALHACKGDVCKGKNRALPLHSCPYREEIGNDPLTLCSCCDECAHECAMDI